MEDEAVTGYFEPDPPPKTYISNLVTQTPTHDYNTPLLLGYYNEKLKLDVDIIKQVYNLGVNNRQFARTLREYEVGKIPLDERHRQILLNIAHKCMSQTSLEINNLVVASEIADYQTPGLASTILNPLGLSKFSPAFNLQGTACSSMPRVIELASKLQGNTLCLIDGITSDIYQTELHKLTHVEPKTRDWITLMFGMLFGDAVAAFIVNTEGKEEGPNYQILRHKHVMNLDINDYQKAAVLRRNGFELSANSNILDTAIKYTDVVLTKMGIETFGHYERIILHTGSEKIINAYQDYYRFSPQQLSASRIILRSYGNTTGCSLPLVLNESKEFKGKALMIGITMGFGVDVVEIET